MTCRRHPHFGMVCRNPRGVSTRSGNMSTPSTDHGDVSRNSGFLDMSPRRIPLVDMFPSVLHAPLTECARRAPRSAEALAKGEAILKGLGHAAIVPRCCGPKGLFSHRLYRVRYKHSSPFSPHYLVELFNNRRWHHWISGFSNGTTINMLPLDAPEMPMLVGPPVELVRKFAALAEAAHEQIEANRTQSRTLAALRDALLPRLLSGELRVAELPH